MSLQVLSVAAELYPLIKTGGLADVAGALPIALAAEHVAVRSLVPGYPSVLAGLDRREAVAEFDELFGGPARLLAGRAGELALFVIDAPHLYNRLGNPYGYDDDAFRFAALGFIAAHVGRGGVDGFRPDIVHAHDWQAGLAAAYLHYGGGARPGTLMTIHNLAFQGQFPSALLGALRLPPEAFAISGVEYFGGIGFLKAGLALSDRITTVSPGYAAEIRTDAGGMGFGGLLRTRADALSGILNGIDTDIWNPATDAALAAQYDAAQLAQRTINKTALQRRMGIAEATDRPVFGVIGRLTWQKGVDLLLKALPALGDAQLALLGAGDAGLEAGFHTAASAAPGRVGVVTRYDEGLAHLIQAGCDVLLVPSRFEPCGLTQLCALRYGALPLVARTGGLADTVIDANEMALAAGVATGWQFAPATGDALGGTIARALALWPDRPAWQRMQRNAMATDVSWAGPARRYAALYRTLERRSA